MSKAFDPLRRLVGQFNARISSLRTFTSSAAQPIPAQPHVHGPAVSTSASHAVPHSRTVPFLGQFQFNFAVDRKLFVPEPVRVAAQEYARQAAGRPHIPSLLSTPSRVLHHQPLNNVRFPHAFAKNVGFFSARNFSSGTTLFHPALNTPAKLVIQMYSKPLGSLPAQVKKMYANDSSSSQPTQAKERSALAENNTNVNNVNNVKTGLNIRRGGEVKKRRFSKTGTSRVSPEVKAFLTCASATEYQHQIMAVCKVNAPITETTAIAQAKIAGLSASDLEGLEDLPKLCSSENCPTNVDMVFLLDASPLWHLDTLVVALHTDSFREPKELNRTFIDDLLRITQAQHQHFLEVSTILRKLLRGPKVREITLQGYELRVHFEGTSLFDMSVFLQQLGIDPKCPHFELEELFVDAGAYRDQYYPLASVNEYYAPSILDNDTWDDLDSLQSSMMMYTDTESVVSFATMESDHEPSLWESHIIADVEDDDQLVQDQGYGHGDFEVDRQEETVLSNVENDVLVLDEEVSHWENASGHLDNLKSMIQSTTEVNERYFGDVLHFLESVEALQRHSDTLFVNSPTTVV